MKLIKPIFFVIAILANSIVFAQANAKMSDKTAYQKYLKFEEGGLLKDEAISAFKKKYNLGKGYSFIAYKTNKDGNEMVHERFQEFYKGIKVEFGVLITHSLNDRVLTVNGELYNSNGLNMIPTLSKNEAFQKVIANVNTQKYLWEDAAQAQLMDYKKPEGELLIFPLVNKGEVKLAYKFDIYAIDPISRADIYVDATTGLILFKNLIIKHAAGYQTDQHLKKKIENFESLVAGNADTKYSGSKSIETTLDATTNKYILLDNSRGGGIATYNSEKTVNYQNVNFSDADNNWTSGEYNNPNKDNGALDAHWGAEKTYDFWKNIFNRNSFDDNGGMLKSYVHYRKVASTNLVNAFWNGRVMSYGDGDPKTSILTSIDICGHEIGHAVCQYTAALAYQNQSGAINEGLSDIWGACIEHYGRTGSLAGTPTNAVWQIGEDLSISGNAMRSMNDPLSKGHPDTYMGVNWTATGDESSCAPITTNDYCGVHNNSGVLNHWFYILSAGKTGINNGPTYANYNVTGIGMVKSSQIIYYAERDYLTANSTFLDVRNATLAVASNLYCLTSPEYIATTNAWYAVNVGPQFVSYNSDVALKSLNKNIQFACGTNFTPLIVFENSGINPLTSVSISYYLDGGALTSVTWTGSLPSCSSQSFSLPTFLNLATGTHILNVSTTTPNDGNSFNNFKSSFVLVNTSGVVNQVNTFENPTDDLISIDADGENNSMWERGPIGSKTIFTSAIISSKAYFTKLFGNYPDKTKTYLVSKCYNLANQPSPKVEFDMGFDLEPYFDILYVQTSTDNGITWTNLDSGIVTDWYNNDGVPNTINCQNCVGGQWTGTVETKTHYSHSLPQASNLMLRFVMVSDDAVNNDGVYIDNFVISSALSNNEDRRSNFVISPNPSNGVVNLSIDNSNEVKINLYDISGRSIFQSNYSNSNIDFNTVINFNPIAKGVYLLNLNIDGKTTTKKIIIN
jgi:Zn-dependent metalloprotease